APERRTRRSGARPIGGRSLPAPRRAVARRSERACRSAGDRELGVDRRRDGRLRHYPLLLDGGGDVLDLFPAGAGVVVILADLALLPLVTGDRGHVEGLLLPLRQRKLDGHPGDRQPAVRQPLLLVE